jgi:hypothetical protein
MTSKAAYVLLLGALIYIGCGSGGGSGRSPQSSLDISGAWRITLSTSQAHIVDPRAPSDPTAMEIKLKQMAPGNGLLQVNDPVYAFGTGCKSSGGSFWWSSAVFEPVMQFVQGSVANGSVGFQLSEGQTLSATGTLIFTGRYNSDGTMSGSLTDGCTLQNATWTATRISDLLQ